MAAAGCTELLTECQHTLPGREAAAMLLARIAGENSDNPLRDIGFEISEGGSI